MTAAFQAGYHNPASSAPDRAISAVYEKCPASLAYPLLHLFGNPDPVAHTYLSGKEYVAIAQDGIFFI